MVLHQIKQRNANLTIVEKNELLTLFQMISILPKNSRIFNLQIDFLTFTWAESWVGQTGTSGNTTIDWPHFFFKSRSDQPQSGSERGVKS